MSRIMFSLMMVTVAMLVAGCSGRVPPVKSQRTVSCLGMADDLKTLKEGDELPRVMQVLGVPDRTYRVSSPFGSTYDVLEYNTGETACARAILHSGKYLRIVFDDKGRYLGTGDSAGGFRLKRASAVRVDKPLLVDPVVFKP